MNLKYRLFAPVVGMDNARNRVVKTKKPVRKTAAAAACLSRSVLTHN